MILREGLQGAQIIPVFGCCVNKFWPGICKQKKNPGEVIQMASLWKLGGFSWRELGKRVWHEVQEDNVFGRAAELSYYFLLALFPFLIFLTSVIGLVLGSGTG